MMQSNKLYFVLFILVALFTQACCHRHGISSVDDLLRHIEANELVDIPIRAMAYTDSIRCTISLSDSTLFKDDGQRNDAAKLTAVIRNISSTDLLAPFFEGGISTYGNSGASIQIRIHKIDSIPIYLEMISNPPDSPDTSFSIIRAGDSVTLFTSMPLSLGCEIAKNCTDTGVYIVQIGFQNGWWRTSTPPVWVGARWSNAVRFNVK